MTGPIGGRRPLSARYLRARLFGARAPWVERSDGMRSAALVRSVELLRMTGTSSTALISGLGARGAIALGIMLPTVLVLRPDSVNVFTIACSAFALSAGLFLTFF